MCLPEESVYSVARRYGSLSGATYGLYKEVKYYAPGNELKEVYREIPGPGFS